MTPKLRDAAEVERARGVAYGLSAYLLWGFLPLYFLLLAPTGPWEIVGWRVLLALVFCAVLLTVLRSWPKVVGLFRDRRTLGLTALAGVLIYANWQIFLLGTLSGHVLETSLGYFINPIMTVLLAMIVLKERLRPLQLAAIGIAAVAVVVIVVGYGTVPWIAIGLTVSFGLYGLVKKQIGPRVDAVTGLAAETLWLTPVAGVQLVVVAMSSGITLGTVGPVHSVLLLLVGVVTAIPLLCFAAGARRVSLTAIGLMQFAAPILQFICGAWILGEPMPPQRWVGFALVWFALILLVVDMVRSSHRSARARAIAPEAPLAT